MSKPHQEAAARHHPIAHGPDPRVSVRPPSSPTLRPGESTRLHSAIPAARKPDEDENADVPCTD